MDLPRDWKGMCARRIGGGKEQMRENSGAIEHGLIRCLVGALKFQVFPCFFVSEFFGGGFLARS
jgi:hypothetical protein